MTDEKADPVTDHVITIGQLRSRVNVFVQERDWDQFHTLKDLAAAIAVEAAELQELFLWREASDVSDFILGGSKRGRLCDELADIVILAMSLANRAEIDLSSAALKKLEANRARYPVDKAKGSPKKYTEFARDDGY